MSKPVAFVCVENSVLSNQLTNRLGDLGYAVRTIATPAKLFSAAEADKPFLIIAELASARAAVIEAVGLIRKTESTKHIPVLGIDRPSPGTVREDAIAGGATLVAMDSGILTQLPQLLEQILAVD